MNRAALSALLCSLVIAGCSDDPALIDSLAATPTSIVIGTDTISIEPWANRDFQPGHDNDSLMAAVVLRPGEAPVIVEQLWVVRGVDVWRAAPEQTLDPSMWSAKYGPPWPVGTEVYLVADIRHEGGGAVQRVRSLPVLITESS